MLHDSSVVLEFAAGLVIVLATLIDVFSTVLAPGPANGHLRIAARLRELTLPLWRYASRTRGGGGRQRLSNVFAPVLFCLAFGAWLLLLLAGFGLLFQAWGGSFTPPLVGVDQALYVAGSSLLTLGVSEVNAHGAARWLVLWAALSGFGVITATITFILQVQASLHQREAGVLTLSGLAGSPPSGIVLLESFAKLKLQPELPAFFKDWRDWSAAVLHSHASYPVLVYFHSMDAESDWLSALSAVLDAATLLEVLTLDAASGSATLMRRSGSRTLSHLCDLFAIAPEDDEPVGDDLVASLCDRLRKAGYDTCEGHGVATRLLMLRADYSGRLDALAGHLGAERMSLDPNRG